MESNIPVPTDNIFKFYALFGLLLFVFSCGSVLYVNTSTNDMVYSSFPELEGLRQIEKPSRAESARIKLLERKFEIAQSDKKFYFNALGVLAGISMLAMFYGFRKWHLAVQPVIDETSKVQLEITKLQLEKLRRELGIKVEPSPSPVAGGKSQADIQAG